MYITAAAIGTLVYITAAAVGTRVYLINLFFFSSWVITTVMMIIICAKETVPVSLVQTRATER